MQIYNNSTDFRRFCPEQGRTKNKGLIFIYLEDFDMVYRFPRTPVIKRT